VTTDQMTVLAILAVAFGLFAYGRWRYDLVAMVALLVLVVIGIVPVVEAFVGFGHPAIITVAAMLIISKALERSGIVDVLSSQIGGVCGGALSTTVMLTCVVTVLSAFMNNVGALALMLPVALTIARTNNISPSRILMPLGFGSILGGLITLIGTPPNIIVSSYRAEATGTPFDLFAFAPVGGVVAIVGVIVLVALTRLLVPVRLKANNSGALDHLSLYLTEVRVTESSTYVGQAVGDLEDIGEGDLVAVALVRMGKYLLELRRQEILRADDQLVIKVDPEALKKLTEGGQVELVHDKEIDIEHLSSQETTISEAVIMPGSTLQGRTPADAQLRTLFGLNLLGVARDGTNSMRRLASTPLRSGDVLLLQGDADALPDKLSRLKCLPLAERALTFGNKLNLLPLSIFLAALVISASGLLPIQISLVCALAVILATDRTMIWEAYDSVDWPVIVLLGAMVPVSQSLQTTGATDLIAAGLLTIMVDLPPPAIIASILLVAMAVSNVVNNAATAILMAPIGISLARNLDVNMDPLLMAVAVGSSCAFMTPIGHQSNLLVMGPGGYRFADFARLGVPPSLAVIGAAVPIILLIWPM